MPQPPKVLLFDLDGVLIDSEPLHRLTWAESLGELGITLSPADEPYLQGRTAEQIVGWLAARPDASPLAIDDLIRLKRDGFERRMADELRPVAGVDAFLRSNKGTIALGLVSSARLRLIGRVLQLFQWRNIFEGLIGADHVTHTKPHPEPYLAAAQRFKVKPSECLVFEDSAVGIESARTAGANVCGVATTLTPRELLKAGAQWTIQDFNDAAGLEPAMKGYGQGKVFGWLARLRG